MASRSTQGLLHLEGGVDAPWETSLGRDLPVREGPMPCRVSVYWVGLAVWNGLFAGAMTWHLAMHDVEGICDPSRAGPSIRARFGYQTGSIRRNDHRMVLEVEAEFETRPFLQICRFRTRHQVRIPLLQDVKDAKMQTDQHQAEPFTPRQLSRIVHLLESLR